MDDSGTTASFAEEDELYRLAEQRGLETLSAARAEAWQAKAEACRCRLCGGAAPAKLPPRPRCLAVDAPAAPAAPTTQEEREPSDSESASDASDGGGDASDGDDDAAWARKTTLVAEHQELCAEALVWRGVPRRRRRREWAALSGAAARAVRAGCARRDGSLAPPARLLAPLGDLEAAVPASVAADVALDCGRGGARSGRARRVVRRVLLAVAADAPATGYCQGLNVVCATLLDGVGAGAAPSADDEALAYWLLLALVEDRCAGWWAGDLGLVSRDVADVAARCGGWATNDAARRPFKAAADLAAALDGTLDLLLSQWALTLFGHNGHKSSPRGAKLLALDLALCAPGNGKAAVLSLALAALGEAAKRRPEDVVAVTAGAAAAFAGLAEGGDARTNLLEAAHGVAATSFFEGRCGVADAPLPPGAAFASNAALWLEASRRVSATSIEALERHVRAHAPALCADSERKRDAAQRAVRSAQLSPLAVFCGRAAPRLAARVLGPPADAAIDGDVVYEWGDGDGWDRAAPARRSCRAPLRRLRLGVTSDASGLLAERADAAFVVVDLADAGAPPATQRPVVFIAGGVAAAAGWRGVMRAAGLFLRRAAGSWASRPDFYVVGPLEDAIVDALRARDDGAAMLRDLRRDERRLLRSMAGLPSARALRAVEALVARATAARASAVALEALAAAPHWTRSWWSRALPRPTETAVEADVRAALEAAARDAALGAGDLPPLGDCCRAFLDLDGAAYARATRGGEAAGLRGRLERAVLVELPAILESAGRRR